MELCYSIFWLVIWWPGGHGKEAALAFSFCGLQVFLTSFFQLGLLVINTFILARLFNNLYAYSTVKLTQDESKNMKIGFWMFSLLAAAISASGESSSANGWCLIDNPILLIKISVYLLFMSIQLGFLIFIFSQLKASSRVSIMPRIRLFSSLVTQMLMIFPLFVYEFLVLTGYGANLNLVEAISILFPLSMLIDASVTLSQVLWKVFRYKTPSLSPGSPMEIEKKNTGDNFRTFSPSKFLYLGQFYR